MQITIAPYGSKKQVNSIVLRDLILRQPLGLQFSKEELSLESDQIHIVAVEDDQIIGVLLLKSINEKEIKMRQVAVATNQQRKGVGVQMVRYAEYHARSKGYELVSLHARENAVPFYKSLNYSIEGKQFEEIGIPHFRMEKKL